MAVTCRLIGNPSQSKLVPRVSLPHPQVRNYERQNFLKRGPLLRILFGLRDTRRACARVFLFSILGAGRERTGNKVDLNLRHSNPSLVCVWFITRVCQLESFLGLLNPINHEAISVGFREPAPISVAMSVKQSFLG